MPKSIIIKKNGDEIFCEFSSSKNAVDPSYWIHQISKVFEWFPKITFTIYQENLWQLPKTWKKDNVLLDRISNL